MNAFRSLRRALVRPHLLLLLALSLSSPKASARVLDNFDDNIKTGWTDFTFVTGFGLPTEADGQFRFEQPPAGRAIFSASQKTSETFELKEGRTVEFRVDVVQGGAKDSFAVLAFLPTKVGGQPNSPGTLAGYGLAKSTTDVLITKGINKYFVADDGAPAHLKNENITLVLNLTVRNGNVIVHTSVLDKDQDNLVIWEKTVIDTPEADPLIGGADDPAAPFITSGYFTLYLYQDFDKGAPENPYMMVYDNAQVFVNDTTVLDNFDDNTKTDWSDFTFVTGFGLPAETSGQFRFEQPPAGRAIFSASQKTSRLFELKEGERLEFSVDVVEGGAKDSFAVLAFLPAQIGGQPNSPGTLAGYGLAKSTTDVLMTKGINKYFIADDGAPARLKNDNITLKLFLEGRGGNVYIRGQVLDKDQDNLVIWEKNVVDTPEADTLIGGTDDPAAPFLTSGYFTLYLYQDFDKGAPENPYKIYYDNAVVFAPPVVGNVAPSITDVSPAGFANFLPATTDISFKASDDQPLSDSRISVDLNGVIYTTANGLSLSGPNNSRTATLSGKLVPNRNYAATLIVKDASDETTTKTIYFDTFSAADALIVEAEDYNFSGAYFNAPVVIPEGSGPQDNSYSLQTGVEGIDFHDSRTSPNGTNTRYRTSDPVRMQHTLDVVRAKFADAGGEESGVFDYDVGDITAGEWLNYTRDFPPGAYEVYLRQALANVATGESVLEQVTSDPTQPDQTVKTLGSFLAVRTGFEFRNFPLTDGAGQNALRLNLSGTTTLRLRQVTPDPGDGARYQNYFVFLRVGDIEVQRALVASLSPTPDSTTDTLQANIRVELQNRDTTVKADTIKLVVNGQTVTPQITSDASGAVVTYSLPELPNSGVVNSATISFKDSQDVAISSTWQFTLRYPSLDPANRVTGTPGDRGFRIHVVQAPAGSGLANSILRAEDQIKANSTIPRAVDVTDVVPVINFNKKAPTSAGKFPEDLPVPGIPFTDPETGASNGLDDFTLEALTYLELTKGIYRFGMMTDDGYKLTSGKNLTDIQTSPLSFEAEGTADETVDFVVRESGIYPFRFLWFERGGEGHAELFMVDIASGERTLINDPNSPSAVKAYLDVKAPPSVTVQSTGVLGTGFSDEPSVVIDENAKTVTVDAQTQSAARFYRLTLPEGSKIKNIQLVGNKLVVTYE